MKVKKTFAVWSEGFCTTGGAGAKFYGFAVGETFEEAIKLMAKNNKRFDLYFDPRKMTWQDCRLFNQ